MTCLRCQAIEAAVAAGNEVSLADELRRQLDAYEAGRCPNCSARATERDHVDGVPREEHERIVRRLNERIAELNARGRRKAS